MRYTIICFLFFAFAYQAYSQTYFESTSIPVEKNGVQLKNAWAGGFDAPQFSPADLDGDGKQDLFVFDRNGSRSFAFINNGNGNYVYSPSISNLFPEMENWALLRDFNRDGVPDIFCWANGGVKVYRGKRTNGVLQFELKTDLLMYTDYFMVNYPKINMYVLTDDIPGFIDVNGDGDLDVLVFGNLLNPSVPQYYENQSVEGGFGSDSLIFDSYNLDECWGKFIESSTSNAVSLGYCKTGGMQGSSAARHAGSTLCPFDENGDGDIDLLLGDISYNSMIMLHNGGSSTDATMTGYDSLFPSYNTSINIPVFPAAYLADVDDDGKNDLLVSPNARTEIRNVKNVLYYKNIGSNNNYTFSYQTDSFLVNTMLDFGSDSKVSVFDYDSDGLLDIIVGNSFYFLQEGGLKISQLALLKNIGTATQPAFQLTNLNYENIAQYQLKQTQPAWGDLDSDGLSDLLLGDYDGYLQFFKNTGSATAKFPALTTPQYFGIDASVLAAPFIYDVDSDGDNDIICGRKDGTLNWYVNYGNAQNPQFSKDSVITNWGGVNLKGTYDIDGLSQPVMYEQNDSMFLFSGSRRGTIFKFLIPGNDLRSERFQLLDSNLLGKSVGEKSTIAVGDFNGDSIPDFVVGNTLGGINFFSSKLMNVAVNEVENGTNKTWEIFPNPASQSLTVSTENNGISKLEIFTLTGEKLVESNFYKVEKVNLSSFSAGLYFAKLNNQTKRFVVLK